MFSFDTDEDGANSHANFAFPFKGYTQAGPSSPIDQVLSSCYALAQYPLGHPSELPSPEQAFNQFAQEYYPLHNTLDTLIPPTITYTDPLLVMHRGNSGGPATHFPPPVASSSFTSYASPRFSEVADADIGEIKMAAIPEERRRRNTAASVRFRIKKKERTVDLERSVSELKGRAEKLEREATDLRRENDWLKEILILKGSQHLATRRQLAPRHLVHNVGIHLTPELGGQGSASSGAVPSSFSKKTTFPQELLSDDSEPRKILNK